MLSERERRRPGFSGGAEVVLADGQAWTLAKPRVRFAPADDGFAVVLIGPGGDAYQALVDAYESAAESGEPGRVLGAELRLARALLLANYDLTPAEVGMLIQFSFSEDDAEGCRIRDEALDVAFGRGKARTAGTPG